MKLSIVIPCYNEERTLAAILDRVLAVDLPGFEREILVVDDGSRDASRTIASGFAEKHPGVVQPIALPRNLGKGAAVRAGFEQATGDLVIVQDADLEYDPNDYRPILAKFADPAVEVVYGSRILGSTKRSYHRYYFGGRLITWFTNLLYGSKLTDEPTCYKCFRKTVLDSFTLASTGFEFCPEVTAQVLRQGRVIHEVPISYNPRSFAEGKKIRWRDGVTALWVLLRLRWRRVQ